MGSLVEVTVERAWVLLIYLGSRFQLEIRQKSGRQSPGPAQGWWGQVVGWLGKALTQGTDPHCGQHRMPGREPGPQTMEVSGPRRRAERRTLQKMKSGWG